MKILAFLVITGLFIWLIMFTIQVISRRGEIKGQISKDQRKELESLRKLRDDLLDQSLDHLEVDPFAVNVLEAIRQSNREIGR